MEKYSVLYWDELPQVIPVVVKIWMWEVSLTMASGAYDKCRAEGIALGVKRHIFVMNYHFGG